MTSSVVGGSPVDAVSYASRGRVAILGDGPRALEWAQRLHGKAEVVIGKQRHGAIGHVDLSFEGKFTRFGNLVRSYQQNIGSDF